MWGVIVRVVVDALMVDIVMLVVVCVMVVASQFVGSGAYYECLWASACVPATLHTPDLRLRRRGANQLPARTDEHQRSYRDITVVALPIVRAAYASLTRNA